LVHVPRSQPLIRVRYSFRPGAGACASGLGPWVSTMRSTAAGDGSVAAAWRVRKGSLVRCCGSTPDAVKGGRSPDSNRVGGSPLLLRATAARAGWACSASSSKGFAEHGSICTVVAGANVERCVTARFGVLILMPFVVVVFGEVGVDGAAVVDVDTGAELAGVEGARHPLRLSGAETEHCGYLSGGERFARV